MGALQLPEFVRAIGVSANVPQLWFLGAGASISSGMPSAFDCIWQWKQAIFLTSNPGLEDIFSERGLPSTQRRIQQWLNSQSIYPPEGAPEEYSVYAERCYPSPRDRRQFFASCVAKATPRSGYQLLAMLAEDARVDSVWTTNFDGLAAKAAASRPLTVVEVGLDCTHRMRPIGRGEMLLVSLHGDFRYDRLKNLESELAEQEQTLIGDLGNRQVDRDVIVCGYSGRDRSIMDCFESAYSKKGHGRLYWCHVSGQDPPASVQNLIALAERHGREAFTVPIYSFDDTLARLARVCLTDSRREQAQVLIDAAKIDDRPTATPFSIPDRPTSIVLKSNAFPVSLPVEIMEGTVDGFDSPGAWARLRSMIENRAIVAALFKGKVLAFATPQSLEDAFAAGIRSRFMRVPIPIPYLNRNRSVVAAVLLQALGASLACKNKLSFDGHSRVWLPDSRRVDTVLGTRVHVYEAALLGLRRIVCRDYLLVRPTVYTEGADGGELDKSVRGESARKVLSGWDNEVFNTHLNEWTNRLLPSSAVTLEYPDSTGSGFSFKLDRRPAFASLAGGTKMDAEALKKVKPFVQLTGLVRHDPSVLFRSRHGDACVRDTNPIRGIAENRPYDFPLTQMGLDPSVRVAILLPRSEANRFLTYLNRLNDRIAPDTKHDYLVEYPGFNQALGLPIQIPRATDSAIALLPEPRSDLSSDAMVRQWRTDVLTAIRQHAQANVGAVLCVCLPRRLYHLADFEDDATPNLHDSAKALCAQLGSCSQFIRESTLGKSYACEIMWWLALSFYSKSMRIPWLLDNLDQGTAFVGLGFALDPTAPPGEHVIVGCSHLYNFRGFGLKYQLSRLESSTWRKGNPYLSRDDARRLAENARQLFFESMQAFPRRVVLHKRTPFHNDEMLGLRDGFDGIREIEMITVEEDSHLRFVASAARGGDVSQDKFPVQRGACILLGSSEALLWIHGTSPSVRKPSWRYFKGRKGIPVPVRIHRYAGTTDLAQVADEILGLSKMSWNSFDLYANLPATILSSNDIARVGRLLQRLGPLSYDYRYFI